MDSIPDPELYTPWGFDFADLSPAMETAASVFIQSDSQRQLDSLWFDPVDFSLMQTQYLTYGRGSINGAAAEDVMVLFADWTWTGEPLVLETGEQRLGWSITLLRQADGWAIDDQGY